MKMNWGCGPVVADGWVNVDNAWTDDLDRVYRSTSEFDDGSFDGIVANHSLQCLTYDLLDAGVQEWHRLLRAGGRLRVLVPDVFQAFLALQSGDALWPGFVAISEPWSLEQKCAHYMTWGGQNRTVFTRRILCSLLHRNGFGRAVEWNSYGFDLEWGWLRAIDTRLGESVVVEVEKP